MNKIWLSKQLVLCKNISFNRRLLVYTHLLGVTWSGPVQIFDPYRDEWVSLRHASTKRLFYKGFVAGLVIFVSDWFAGDGAPCRSKCGTPFRTEGRLSAVKYFLQAKKLRQRTPASASQEWCIYSAKCLEVTLSKWPRGPLAPSLVPDGSKFFQMIGFGHLSPTSMYTSLVSHR